MSILIKNGFNVNWRDNSGITPINYGNTLNNWLSKYISNLKLAIRYYRNTETVQLLLDKGASVYNTDRNNKTALYYGEKIV